LWVTVKYFHPYLAYRDIDWDAALVSAIPKVNAASNSEEYAAAIQGMLDTLEDPLTRVMKPKTLSPSTGLKVESRTDTDGILVITIPELSDFVGLTEQLQKVFPNLQKARAAVFDLRTAGERSAYALSMSGVAGRLTSRPIYGPGRRSRFHSGLAPITRAVWDDYFSAFALTDGFRVLPSGGAKDCCVPGK
jgi:hypothetical protein